MNEIITKELNFIKKFMEFSHLGNHLTGKSISIKSLSQDRHFFLSQTEQLSKIYQIPYANLSRNKNVQLY